MTKVLLIGSQGSGKSTQAKLLSQFLKVPLVSTGDIFRNLSNQDTDQGKSVKQILDEGRLINDETTSKIVQERLKKEDCKNGFIMDGYPRNIVQLKTFDPNFNKVFYLKVAEDVVLERLLKRGREDDSEELIRTRLGLYYLQTQPLLEYYKNKGILVEIDGVGEVDAIQKRLRSNLSK